MIPPNDEIRLRHMLDAAQEALRSTSGKTRADLDQDRTFAFGLVKLVEIIGEATRHVSPQTQQMAPQVPWRDVIGMRNHLVHAYFDISFNILWDTLDTNLPSLVRELETVLQRKP